MKWDTIASNNVRSSWYYIWWKIENVLHFDLYPDVIGNNWICCWEFITSNTFVCKYQEFVDSIVITMFVTNAPCSNNCFGANRLHLQTYQITTLFTWTCWHGRHCFWNDFFLLCVAIYGMHKRSFCAKSFSSTYEESGSLLVKQIHN